MTSEADPSADAKDGAAGSSPSEPPPSSKRGFIGTNTDAAQAYVPPTTLPETPEPPVPDTKIALAGEFDPRKAPTHPSLKKAAKALAQEIASERPPPMIEAPPDSQASGIRRGAGYAPTRSNFPAPAPSSPKLESLRKTPAAPLSKSSLRAAAALRSTPPAPLSKASRPPPSESAETPQQRRAAIVLVLLFAALLAVAVYFFLRRAPAPPGGEGSTPGGTATSAGPIVPPSAGSLSVPSPQPSSGLASSGSPSSSAPAGAASTADAAPSTSARGSTESPSEAGTHAASPSSSTASAAVPATSGPEKKTERWF